jgi:tetratricopeptide (TPR) repeat protein
MSGMKPLREPVVNASSGEETRVVRSWWTRRMRNALWVCLVAFLIHLIPLLFPRDMPEQELAIARAIANPAQRVGVLKPLLENPKATGANLREAAELLREGSPMDAYELTKASERKEPDAVENQLLLARICHGQRMSRCEEESFTRAERLAPADPRASLLRADFHERDGNLEEALKALRAAYQKAPAYEGVGVRYARMLSAANQGDEAIQVLESQQATLGKAGLSLEEGLVRVAQGRLQEGRRMFLRAVEADPKLAPAYYHLGLTAFRLGDIDAAEEALRESDRLDMRSMRALSALCAIQRSTRRIDAMTATRMDLERRFPEKLDAVRSACQTP